VRNRPKQFVGRINGYADFTSFLSSCRITDQTRTLEGGASGSACAKLTTETSGSSSVASCFEQQERQESGHRPDDNRSLPLAPGTEGGSRPRAPWSGAKGAPLPGRASGGNLRATRPPDGEFDPLGGAQGPLGEQGPRWLSISRSLPPAPSGQDAARVARLADLAWLVKISAER
jgi:hypothetical protein